MRHGSHVTNVPVRLLHTCTAFTSNACQACWACPLTPHPGHHLPLTAACLPAYYRYGPPLQDPYSANCALSLTSLCAAGDPLCRLTLEAWEGVGEGVGPEGSSSGSSSSTTTGGNRASAVLRAYFASACSSGSSGGEVGVGPSVPGAGAETAAGAGPLGAGQSGVIVRMELPGEASGYRRVAI